MKKDVTSSEKLHEVLRKTNSTTDAIVAVFEGVARHLRRGELEACDLATPAEFRRAARPVVVGLVSELDKLHTKLRHMTGGNTRAISDSSKQLEASAVRLKELISPDSLVEENPVWHDQIQVQADKTLSALNELKLDTQQLPREPIRAVRTAALKIEQLVCLHELLRMRSMVSDLKMETKALSDLLRSDRTDVEPRDEVDLANVLDVACDAMLSAARASDIEIRRDYGDKAIFCRADSKQLLTAIGNLLDNAVKYSHKIKSAEPTAAWVTVRLRGDDTLARIEIENWGLAITTEERETGRIYERGERGEVAKRAKIPGTGMGLAFVRDIMKALGGSITCDSRPARPQYAPTDYKKSFVTTFILSLPRA